MGKYQKVIIRPTGIVADVEIGDRTFKNVTVKGEWEGLVKLEGQFAEGHIIGGKRNFDSGVHDLFHSFFRSPEGPQMFFEPVEISPCIASGDFLKAIQPKEEKESNAENNKEEL